MPTYDYNCSSCGYRFEVFQGMNENQLIKCPRCGGTVQRMIGGGSGLIFKGSGFYITDYKKNKQKEKV
ncbi:zinc ribbon domain-containing protein [candidate division KSB1 bacterium]|nr:zinc ribbon domain-containing protein [candidate division KSB1 bacterium]